jgi:hypothetical protein
MHGQRSTGQLFSKKMNFLNMIKLSFSRAGTIPVVAIIVSIMAWKQNTKPYLPALMLETNIMLS